MYVKLVQKCIDDCQIQSIFNNSIVKVIDNLLNERFKTITSNYNELKSLVQKGKKGHSGTTMDESMSLYSV